MDSPVRNTFAPHPATLLDTPKEVTRALFKWCAASHKYTTYQQSQSGKCAIPSIVGCLWNAHKLSRAYVALRKVVLAQVDSTWYGSAMWLALDEGVNPFNDGLFIAFLVNSLLP